MVEVKASEAFINLLEDFSKEENLTLEEQETVDHDIAAKHVSLRSIRCLHKYRPNVKLHEAIKGSNISIPYAEKIKISEEKKAADERMKARRGYLQVQQETRDYNRMVYGTTRLPTDNEETISSAIKSVKYQMAISSNMLAAMAGVFGVGYYSAQKFLLYNKNQCLVVGLLGAISILFIEMVLYIIRAYKMEKIQTKETKKTDSCMKIVK